MSREELKIDSLIFFDAGEVKVQFLLVDGTEKEGDTVQGINRPFVRDTRKKGTIIRPWKQTHSMQKK